MKLPHWMDQAFRIRSLGVRLDAAMDGYRDSLRLYARKCDEVLRLTVERDNAREDRDAAQKQADSLRTVVDSVRREHAKDRTSWSEQRQAQVAEIRRLEREMDGRQVPVAVVAPPDRTGLYRLEAENARLRTENADLKRKYEGVPS